jgi:hypothetical protein
MPGGACGLYCFVSVRDSTSFTATMRFVGDTISLHAHRTFVGNGSLIPAFDERRARRSEGVSLSE